MNKENLLIEKNENVNWKENLTQQWSLATKSSKKKNKKNSEDWNLKSKN